MKIYLFLIIKQLLEIKWWNWDDEKINQYNPLLCNDNFITNVKV